MHSITSSHDQLPPICSYLSFIFYIYHPFTNMSTSSQKQMPVSIKLSEKVKAEEEVDVEMVVEALEKLIEGDIYKVLVEEESGVGAVWSVNIIKGDVEEEITKCPPPLVKHLCQLIFNRERAGRYTFYFGKTITELSNNEVPLWI